MIVWLLRHLANFAVVGVAAFALYAHRDQFGTMLDRRTASNLEAADRHLATAARLGTGAGSADARSPDARSADARSPDAGAPAQNRTLRLRADRHGHVFVFADIGGTAVRFMIDPSARDVVLSPADGARVGISPEESAFSERFRTANGPVRAAEVMLRDVRIGTLRLDSLPAVVPERPIGVSILGETFLRRLKSYARSGNEMVLTW